MLGVILIGLICRDRFFGFLISLASWGVMSRLGSIVVVIGCCDGSVVSRCRGALPSGRFVPVICLGPFLC